MDFNLENSIDLLEKEYDNNEKEIKDDNKFKLYEGTTYVPRVTVLLDTIKEDYLLQWANSLGWKRLSYTKTLQEYADIGTEVHNEIENFIKFGELGMTPGFISFKDWWDKLIELNEITNVRSEVSMTCPYFGGTTDLFFNANGKNCLVDFKTSKNIGYKYIMQLSAYVYMMQTIEKISIDHCIILQMDKYTPYKYQAYRYDLDNPFIKNMFQTGLRYMFVLSKGYNYKLSMERMFTSSENSAKIKGEEVVFK